MNIVSSARQIYGALHMQSEMQNCLDFLSTKQLKGFIEIGSANGASFHCWACVIPDGPKVSVDINYGFGIGVEILTGVTNMPLTPSSELAWPAAKRRNDMWRAHFDNVRIVEGNSMARETIDATRVVLATEKVDWLFIDACHEDAAVTQDLTNYKQFVNPGGYIGFHDVHQTEDMEAFWTRIKSEHPDYIEVQGGTGIGIIPV